MIAGDVRNVLLGCTVQYMIRLTGFFNVTGACDSAKCSFDFRSPPDYIKKYTDCHTVPSMVTSHSAMPPSPPRPAAAAAPVVAAAVAVSTARWRNSNTLALALAVVHSCRMWPALKMGQPEPGRSCRRVSSVSVDVTQLPQRLRRNFLVAADSDGLQE
jgi:hypothetical protein